MPGLVRYGLVLLGPLVLAGLGVSAAVLGEEDDAPGLVGIGCLLATAAVVLAHRLGVRSGRRSHATDV